MAALTATLVKTYDLGGGTNQLKIFTVTPQANGDTVALATWFSALDAVHASLIAGQDAALSFISPAFSGTTVTLTQLEQDGTAATNWTGASIQLWVIGQAEI